MRLGQEEVPLYHLEQLTITLMKQTRAFVFGQHVSSANATMDMHDQAARSESWNARASGGEHTRLGEWLLLHFPPGFGDQRSTGSQKQRCCISSTASILSKCVREDEHDPNAAHSTTIQALDLRDRSFATYGEDGLGASWSFLGAGSGGSELQAALSALPFPRPFITSAACISRDFLTVKRSTLLHSKNCAFRFVILMDRNDSYKQSPDDFRWQGQNRFL
jgi:hypothetical protein